MGKINQGRPERRARDPSNMSRAITHHRFQHPLRGHDARVEGANFQLDSTMHCPSDDGFVAQISRRCRTFIKGGVQPDFLVDLGNRIELVINILNVNC
jgi:hypothetical protein